jgi:hypothetical protein
MSAATDDPTGIPIPTGGTYLAERQIKEWKGELQNLEGMLADPKSRLEDRGEVTQRLGRIKKALATESPPDTTPAQRDALAREEQALREEIVPCMPSQEEMRKCPPGAIGKHQAFERKFKSKIIRWKNIRRILNKGNDDPDISNLEMFRGKQSTLNMDNALIPGKDHFPSPNTQAYREGYDRTFGGAEAAQDQIAELQKKIEALEKRLSAEPVVVKKPTQQKEMIPAACGKLCKGNVGKLSHERAHKCAEPIAQGVAT